jgi:CubicO group peptidase (beta-lactamase class C family)
MHHRISRDLSAAVTVLFLCGIAAQSASAQNIELPSTKPGRLVGQWLKLCDMPNPKHIAAWFTENISAEAAKSQSAQALAQDNFDLCACNGGFRVVEVKSSDDPNVLSLLVTGTKSDLWFTFTLAANVSGKVDQFSVNPATPPESAMPRDLSDAAVSREVEQTVSRLSEYGLFSGIVAVARGNKIIASANAGYADREHHTAVTGSSQFTVGSMGKLFTAVAIGQLVDQKKLSFDDTVGKFFPEYPNQAVRDKVTVGMLLSHTAGLGDFLMNRTPEMMKNGVKRAEEFIPLYEHDEPQFTPGSSFAYSNAGLALAGAIIEKASGESYPDYLRRHVFAVAGMRDSDPNNIPYHSEKMVIPYTRLTGDGSTSDWHEAPHDIGSPAGGAISTADDLIRFAEALRDGKLMSQATFREMAKGHATAPGGQYGYVFGITDIYGRTFVGHRGGYPGVSTSLRMLLDSSYTVVVLANQDPPADAYVGAMLSALVAEKAKREKKNGG